ncbi:Multi antimicrobial extrusion protein [Parasponia andersonii]|uniref:Protein DETOXIFICATION n=1 Tax=Parasponia andersonii TaxID=3476 RepID=A0A2P5CAT5_PARAD|nr:Multi antimicrobial extrusion protein [Parasponia andersonii]
MEAEAAEEVPLLAENGEEEEDYKEVKSLREVSNVFWAETVKLWRIAGPIVCTIVCNYAVNSLTNIFVGHIGELELSAVTISLCVIGTFSFGFMLGMGSALETLCGQAFGAGQVKMLGIYMQRSWLILTVSCFALLPFYIFAAPILRLLGQADEVADMAGYFSILVIPQLFSLAINFPTQKFLQAQSKVSALAWIGFVTLIVHIGLLWLFITYFKWGIVGAALAFDISSWILVIAQVLYVIGWCSEGWSGFSWLAFKDLWGFVKLSLASAVMLCLEVWYFMCLIIVTGHLNNAVIAVDSLSICMNLNGWEAMLFIGINAAVSVRVSNELGMGRPLRAKYSVYSAVFQSLLFGIFFAVLIMITKDYFAVIFTNSKDVQQAVSQLAYLLGITMLLNSIQPVISGVAIGGGWQDQVAYINLGCYYIFGLPLGMCLGYAANLGVMGVWGGMICGTAAQTLLLVIILYRTNWNKEVEETTERMRKWGGQDLNDKAADDSI